MIALIAGILRLDGKTADEGVVEAMLGEMSFEGCQFAFDIQSDGPFAAGVMHVAPAGAAPVEHPRIHRSSDHLIAADLRLYNGTRDPMDRLATSLQTLAADSGKALHGDFAYACWIDQKLILTRDQFGIRPLQYTHRPGEYVAFASLPGPLLRTGLAPRDLDAETLKTYPIAGMAIGPRTYFKAIQSVPAAHSITFNLDGSSKQRRYWRLPLGPLIRADQAPEEIANELSGRLKQAVRRRMLHSEQAAVHLSGGLDSGSIAAIAAQCLSQDSDRLPAFCLAEARDDTTPQIVDELPYATAIQAQFTNVDLHAINTPDQITLMQRFDPDLFLSIHPDEPEEQVLRQAAELGATTILSGWGGDEVTTWRGHGNLAELFWSGQWQSMMQAIRNKSKVGGSTPFAIFRKAVLSESLPAPLRNLIRSRHGTQQPPWLEAIKSFCPPANHVALETVPEREYAADSRVQRRGGLEHWSLSGRLETFALRGARHGMAYVYPMLDLDLLEFAVRIPATLLKDDTGNRAIFRRATQGILPDKVRLKQTKLSPYPSETLRQSLQKAHMLQELTRMRTNPTIKRFVDIDGLSRYISNIREPDQIQQWMNDAAQSGEQVEPFELYHVFAVWLAWYLDQHGTEIA